MGRDGDKDADRDVGSSPKNDCSAGDRWFVEVLACRYILHSNFSSTCLKRQLVTARILGWALVWGTSTLGDHPQTLGWLLLPFSSVTYRSLCRVEAFVWDFPGSPLVPLISVARGETLSVRMCIVDMSTAMLRTPVLGPWEIGRAITHPGQDQEGWQNPL